MSSRSLCGLLELDLLLPLEPVHVALEQVAVRQLELVHVAGVDLDWEEQDESIKLKKLIFGVCFFYSPQC